MEELKKVKYTKDFDSSTFYIPYYKESSDSVEHLAFTVDSVGNKYVEIEKDGEVQKAKVEGGRFTDVDGLSLLTLKLEDGPLVLPISKENNADFVNNFSHVVSGKFDESIFVEATPDAKPSPAPITPNEYKTEIDHKALFGGPSKFVETNGVEYFYLPYKTATGKDSLLMAMRFDGKTYLNLAGVDPTKTSTTCEIFSLSVKEVEGKQVLQVEGNYKGQKDTITLPITADGNESLIESFSALIDGREIEAKPLERDKLPKVEDLKVDPASIKEVLDAEDKSLNEDKLKAYLKHTQQLVETNFEFAGEKLNGLTQTIDMKNTTLKEKQTLTLLDSAGGSNILAAIEHKDSAGKPVAVFMQDGDNIKFSVSEEFLTKFKAENPEVKLPDVSASGGYYTFDVDKLKLDENLTIQDVQIKSAGKDFAVMFSALGCQIKDKEGTVGSVKNETSPFNLSVSTKFMESAYLDGTACKIERKDPALGALLISAIQMERKKEDAKPVAKRKEPVTVTFGKDPNKSELYSIPIKVNIEGLEEKQYLYVRKEVVDGKEKTYAYMHLGNERSNRPTTPKFWEINEAGIEATEMVDGVPANPSLYLGMKDGRNVSRVNLTMDINDPTNVEALRLLGSKDGLIRSQIEKTAKFDKTDATSLGKTAVGDMEFEVKGRPAESSTKVKSLSGVAEMSRTEKAKEKESKSHLAPPTPIPAPSPVPGPIPPIPPPHDKEDEELEYISEPVPDIKPRTPDEKPNKKTNWTNILLGLGFVAVAFSVFIPVLNTVAIALFTATVVNEVKPWRVIPPVVKGVKGIGKAAGKVKDRIKTREKGLDKKASKTKSAIEKKKDARTSVRNKIDRLKREREKLDETILPLDYKMAKIGEIEGELKSAQMEEKALTKEIKSLEAKQEAIGMEQQKKELEKDIAAKEKIDKRITQIEHKNIGYMNEQVSELHGQKESLQQEKEEISELEALMKKDESELSEEELARLKKLQGKFKLKGFKVERDDLDESIARMNEENERALAELDEEILKVESEAEKQEKEIEENREKRRDAIEDVRDQSDVMQHEIDKKNKESKSKEEDSLENFTLTETEEEKEKTEAEAEAADLFEKLRERRELNKAEKSAQDEARREMDGIDRDMSK